MPPEKVGQKKYFKENQHKNVENVQIVENVQNDLNEQSDRALRTLEQNLWDIKLIQKD